MLTQSDHKVNMNIQKKSILYTLTALLLAAGLLILTSWLRLNLL